MNNRLFAILIVVGLALAGGGCASKGRRNRHEVLLPPQTGSNFARRITVDDESSVEKTKPRESKRPLKKRVKTERAEPEKTKRAKPDEPDRFR